MSGPKVGASPMHRAFPWDSQPWLDLFHTSPHRPTSCPLPSQEPACGFEGPGLVCLCGAHSPLGNSYLISLEQVDPQCLLSWLCLSPPLPCLTGETLVSKPATSQTSEGQMRCPASRWPRSPGAVLQESPSFSSCEEEGRKQCRDSHSRSLFPHPLWTGRGRVAGRRVASSVTLSSGRALSSSCGSSVHGILSIFFSKLRALITNSGNRNAYLPSHKILLMVGLVINAKGN